MMTLVYNSGADINITFMGEKVVIPSKKSIILDAVIAEKLQEQLPGLEYSQLSGERAEQLLEDIAEGQKAEAKRKAVEAQRQAEAILYDGMSPDEIEDVKKEQEKAQKKEEKDIAKAKAKKLTKKKK
jgi:hypothetical protein